MKVSIFGMILHEYRGVLRANVKSEEDFLKIYENINKIYRSKLSEISKHSFIFLTIVIAIQTLSELGTVSIKTTFMEISVPKVYALFGASLLWSNLSLNVLSFIQIITQVSETQIFKGRAPKYHSALLHIRGVEGTDLVGAIRPNHIAIPPLWVVTTASIFHLAVFFAAVLPLLAAGFFVIAQLFQSIFEDTNIFLAKLLALSGLASALCSTIYWPIYFLKFKVRKDKDFIRWLFLRQLSNSRHPQTDRWISEK